MGALEPALAVGHAAILLPLEFFDDSLHLTVLASVAACPFHLLRRRASAAASCSTTTMSILPFSSSSSSLATFCTIFFPFSEIRDDDSPDAFDLCFLPVYNLLDARFANASFHPIRLIFTVDELHFCLEPTFTPGSTLAPLGVC